MYDVDWYIDTVFLLLGPINGVVAELPTSRCNIFLYCFGYSVVEATLMLNDKKIYELAIENPKKAWTAQSRKKVPRFDSCRHSKVDPRGCQVDNDHLQAGIFGFQLSALDNIRWITMPLGHYHTYSYSYVSSLPFICVKSPKRKDGRVRLSRNRANSKF